ncbi:MAG: metal-dependent hydrolase [Fibrobacterota bacterium]
MPGYKVHTIGGVAAAAGILALTGWAAGFVGDDFLRIASTFQGKLIMTGTCIMAALWPDADTNSSGQDIFYSAFFIIDVFLIVLGFYKAAAFLGLFAILPVFGKHRGWTHSRAACFLVPLPLLILPVFSAREFTLSGLPLYLAALAGYLSHLLLDRKLFR